MKYQLCSLLMQNTITEYMNKYNYLQNDSPYSLSFQTVLRTLAIALN